MEKDTEKTIVIFRVDKKSSEVIAIFPELPAGLQGNMTAYVHIGQHGAAARSYVWIYTRPATPTEYESLKKELESIGYNLDIRKRAGRAIQKKFAENMRNALGTQPS